MSQEFDLDKLPSAVDALAEAIREGHVEENPENTEEVRITRAGIARYLVLKPLAEAMISDDDPTDESPVAPPDPNEPEAPPAEEVIEVDEAPPPMEPPQ